jgi:hypothetical protein
VVTKIEARGQGEAVYSSQLTVYRGAAKAMVCRGAENFKLKNVN